MTRPQKNYLFIIILLIAVISVLHYNTSTKLWQYHLVYMQAYFIPILLAAFQFGVKGGLSAAFAVSLIYLPHIMLQWGGLIENNLMRFLQILLFNILGYLTGLKAQGERQEKENYRQAAARLQESLEQQKKQSEAISAMEQQLRIADRLATVGELTASLAHEVRNPLASIRGAVEIIRDTVPQEMRKLEFFDILIQDTERLNKVVENYLNFARRRPQPQALYNFNETLKNILLMLGAQARRNRIRLTARLPEETIRLRGDPHSFWQVAMNVLLNAMQAMPNGGEIIVWVRQLDANENPSSGEPKPRWLRFSVKDQGEGIPQDKLQEIFSAFYTTRPNGAGLGLAIVKRIAKENNWKMEINSRPGQGTEFALFMPID